jgi:hypothetical protein
MQMYASRTGTRRNLAALRAAGWRLLVSATGVHRHEGFCYMLGRKWNLRQVLCRRSGNSNGKGRGAVPELRISNYEVSP